MLLFEAQIISFHPYVNLRICFCRYITVTCLWKCLGVLNFIVLTNIETYFNQTRYFVLGACESRHSCFLMSPSTFLDLFEQEFAAKVMTVLSKCWPNGVFVSFIYLLTTQWSTINLDTQQIQQLFFNSWGDSHRLWLACDTNDVM